MKTIRHSFSKQPSRLPASKGGRTGGRTIRRRGSRDTPVSMEDAMNLLRARVRRPLGKLTCHSTRTHRVIDEER